MAEAAAFLNTNRPGEAERIFRALIARDPKDGAAQSNLGVALERQGRLEDAALAYAAAADLNPRHAQAQFNLGAALLKLGRKAEAATALRHAADCIKATTPLDLPLARALFNADLYTLAADIFRRAATAQPSTEALFGLGLSLRGAGRDMEAIAALEQVLALDPSHGRAAFHAGELSLWVGRLDASLKHLRTTLRWMLDGGTLPPTRKPKLKNFDASAARDCLFALKDALDRARIEFFLVGGTALGCIREGDFISFDSDIDVGVRPGTPPEDIIEAVAGQPGIDYLYHDVHRDQVIRIRFGAPSGIGGDVFLYQEDEDGHWCGVQRGALAVKWRDFHFHLAPVEFHGRSFLIPDPVEQYLTENYGDWRTPDPFHIAAFSSKNLVGGYAGIAQCTILAATIHAVADGDTPRVRRYCREILERDPADTLIAQLLSTVSR